MPVMHPSSKPRIANAPPPKINIDLPHVDYSPLVFWRMFVSINEDAEYHDFTPSFAARAFSFDHALHYGNHAGFTAPIGYDEFAELFNRQDILYKIHASTPDGSGYYFPANGQEITLAQIDLTLYNKAFPIHDPLLVSLGIINENGTLNHPNLLMIARKVLHAPSPPPLPRNFRAGPSSRPYTSRKHSHFHSGPTARGRPRFPRRSTPYPVTKLPCHHPMSRSPTLIDNNIASNGLEVNSISLGSSSTTSSIPPTPNSSPSVITEDDVFNMLEDPLREFSKAVFSMPKEAPTIDPSILSSLPRIDDPVVEPSNTPTSIIPSQNITDNDHLDPSQGVASLSLDDEEDAEGSLVDVDISMTEGEAAA